MACSTTGDRAVVLELGRRIAMASQAEIVKACLSSDPQVRARAAMTADASAITRMIDKIMVALHAAHWAMLVMGEINRQACGARHHWLA